MATKPPPRDDVDLAGYPAGSAEIRRLEESFRAYIALLDKWRTVTNLISERDFPHVFRRHIVDSLQLVAFSDGARRWLDIGSGAGFPGIAAAVALGRSGSVVCVERDKRKCAFLRQVARELSLDVVVIDRSIEDVAPAEVGPVDIVTARAFASVPELLATTASYLKRGAMAIWPRGRTWPAEVHAIRREEFALDVLISAVDSQGAIFRIRKPV